MFDRIKTFLLYDGMKKENYAMIKDAIYEKNRRSMAAYSMVAASFFFVLFILSLFVSSIAVNRVVYLTMMVLAVILIMMLHTAAKHNKLVGEVSKYILEVAILAFGIILGTMTTSTDQPSTVFVVMVVMVPMLVYDKVLNSLLVRIIMIGLYLYMALPVKSQEAIEYDMVNLMCFTLVSTICIGFMQQNKSKTLFLERHMHKEIKEQTSIIKQHSNRLRDIALQTITAFSRAIDAKDEYTNGHSTRVAEYSRMIAKRLGKSVYEQRNIYMIALMHDVGKVGIPDSIINKPAKLTDEEYAVIKEHPVIGYNILKDVDQMPDIAIGARLHHERYDGKGYPLGLAGKDIPEIARIISVADAYDAMTSNRSYRSPLPQEKVADEIRKGRGTQFDPVFADVMLDIISEDKNYTLHE